MLSFAVGSCDLDPSWERADIISKIKFSLSLSPI